MASSSSYKPPCAACKFLRRKCIPGCVFAPYFPPEDPMKFMIVHKIYGASNVSKLLIDCLPHQREDMVTSLAYDARARVRDPINGAVGIINSLQQEVDRLQKELDDLRQIRHARNAMPGLTSIQPLTPPQNHLSSRRIGGSGFDDCVNRTWNRPNAFNPHGNTSGYYGGGPGGGGGNGGGGA